MDRSRGLRALRDLAGRLVQPARPGPQARIDRDAGPGRGDEARRRRPQRRRPGRGRGDRHQGREHHDGLLGREDATAEAIVDGWFHSGDLAKVDEDGYFFIVDRKKDLIIRGGYNVYPREVEEALYEHEDVAEVAVIGIPDDAMGEEIGAAVALKSGAKVTEDELQAFAKERLAAYKYPRAVWIVDQRPKGPTGKIRARGRGPQGGHGVSPASTATTTKGQADTRVEEAEASAELASNELSAPLDLLLADASSSPLRRFLPGMSGVRFGAALVRRPGRVAGRTLGLASELAKVGIGRSELGPHEKDRRFTDEAWAKNPLFKRTLQSYLAVGESLRGLLQDADLDWGDNQRMGFIVDNLVEAAAPSNNPALNPRVLKRMLDTGGGNLLAGGRRFIRDFATAPRVPSMVEPDAFEVGTDLAVTPGEVVLRTDSSS